jgi:hypothetical protein
MPSKSASELTLTEETPAPPQGFQHNPKQTRAAIKRCCAAWQRAYDAYLEDPECAKKGEAFAAGNADKAYCGAMPPLADYQSIRDFIACAAHGMLIGAIYERRANKLLYAAQVALASLHFEPKPRKS